MTPEMKQALLDLISKMDTPQGSDPPQASSYQTSSQGAQAPLNQNTPAHADAQQDYDQICQVIESKLAPAFEMIGQELKSLRDENDGLKDIVYKLITSFDGAVTSHRRTGLQESVMGKYGPDLESLAPVYKDFTDGDITSDLLDALMSDEGDPMESAGKHLEVLKGRFGKYMGGGAPSSMAVSVETPQGGESEPPKPGDSEKNPGEDGAEIKPDETKKTGPPAKSDPVLNMMKMLESQRGPRKTA